MASNKRLLSNGIWSWLIYAALAAFLMLFLVYPLILILKSGFLVENTFSLYWYKAIFSDYVIIDKIINSLYLAFWTTLVVTAVSLPISIVINKYQFAGKALLSGLLLVPMILPPFVGAIAVKRFFAQFGIFNRILATAGIIKSGSEFDWLGSGFIAVVIMQALHLFPIMYLNIISSLSNIDPAFIQASHNLGASSTKTFFRITLPLIRPGIFAGGVIVFIWSFTDLGTPLIFGYENIVGVHIFNRLRSNMIDGSTYGLVVIVLVITALLYITGKVIFGKSIQTESAKATIQSQTNKAGLLGTVIIWLALLIIILLALLPHIGVVLNAFSTGWIDSILPQNWTLQHIKYVLSQGQTKSSIINSIKYSSISMIIDIIIGLCAGWLIVRKKIAGRKVLDSLLMTPLAVPGLIIAAGFVAMTVPGSFFERIGPWSNPFIILVIAYSVRRIPFAVRSAVAGFEQIPQSLEDAARNFGSSAFGAVMKITIPLMAANIVSAAVLTFSFAMLEVSDSLILAQEGRFYPITKQMYELAMDSNPQSVNTACALGVIGMVILGGSLLAAAGLMGKKLGAIFRA